MAPDRQHPPIRSRNRPTLSCETCRKRKARCDRKHPCSNCARWQVEACVYTPRVSDEAPQNTGPPFTAFLPTHRRLAPLGGVGPSSLAKKVPSPARQPSTVSSTRAPLTPSITYAWRTTPLASIFVGIVDPVHGDPARPPPMAVRNGHEEVGLCDSTPDESSLQTIFPALDGTTGPMRGAFYKNRYIGQSHWMYVWPLYPPAIIIVGQEMNKKSRSWKAFQECKDLARQVKSRRPPAVDSKGGALGFVEFGKYLPSLQLAEKLIDGYFQTFETVYRILLVPTFKQEIHQLWAHESSPSREILIQAQLCLAIGATVCEEGLSLRPYITQWVTEGCTWAAHSTYKKKLSIAGLQVLCLLHIARQTCAIGADLTWIPAGSLIRMAMCMGFHLDPSMLPAMPAADVELRRRLWATVLEITLESSISAGAPPLITVDDLGGNLPSNCNDQDLIATPAVDQRAVPIVARPDSVSTDTSTQIALAKSLKTRLAIIRTINQPYVAMTTSYDDLTKLSTTIDAACQQLHADMSLLGTTSFQRRYCNLMLERYYLVIHIPYLTLATKNAVATYSLSRTTCIDTALRVIYAGLTSASQFFKASPLAAMAIITAESSQMTSSTTGPLRQQDRFAMLLQRGAGHLRSIPLQCLIIVALELITRTSASPGSAGTDIASSSSKPGGATLKAALAERGCIGHFHSLRDIELHLLLRVGAEWTARRVSEAADLCAKDNAFISLQLAIAEEQIKRNTGSAGGFAKSGLDDGDRNIRERYTAAFEHCRDLIKSRLGEGVEDIGTQSANEVTVDAGASIDVNHVSNATFNNSVATHAVDFGFVPPEPSSFQPWTDGDAGTVSSDLFEGFWMGDIADDLDWDEIMDLGTL